MSFEQIMLTLIAVELFALILIGLQLYPKPVPSGIINDIDLPDLDFEKDLYKPLSRPGEIVSIEARPDSLKEVHEVLQKVLDCQETQMKALDFLVGYVNHSTQKAMQS